MNGVWSQLGMSRRQPSLLSYPFRAPWWVSGALAPLAYIAISERISSRLETMVPGADLASSLRLPGSVAASFFTLIAALSAIHARQRNELLNRQESLETLRSGFWKEFELLVAEACRRDGYKVICEFKGGADGGVDLDLKRDALRILVRCKRWIKNIGAPTVRELYGVLQSKEADAILVTSSHYTDDARAFAAGKAIELVSGTDLLVKTRQLQNQPGIPSVAPSAPITQPSSQANSPDGPRCVGAMLQRTARRGANTGSTFWGCQSFPKCWGIVRNVGLSI